MRYINLLLTMTLTMTYTVGNVKRLKKRRTISVYTNKSQITLVVSAAVEHQSVREMIVFSLQDGLVSGENEGRETRYNASDRPFVALVTSCPTYTGHVTSSSYYIFGARSHLYTQWAAQCPLWFCPFVNNTTQVHSAAVQCSIRRVVPSSVYQSLVVALCYHGWIMVTRHWLASRLACLFFNRFQSVLNAAAWSIAGLRRSEHITDALASFHWLRAPERIKFKLAVIVYRPLHGTAPQYLSDQLQYVADLPTRHRGRLRSSTSSLLEVRPSRCVTVGHCRPTTLAQSTWWFPICPIARNISPKAEKSFISAIIPRHCSIAQSPCSYLYLGHYK